MSTALGIRSPRPARPTHDDGDARGVPLARRVEGRDREPPEAAETIAPIMTWVKPFSYADAAAPQVLDGYRTRGTGAVPLSWHCLTVLCRTSW